MITAGPRTRARCAAAAVLLLVAGVAQAAEAPKAAAGPPGRLHVVARGDTLSGIAARYGVSVSALVAANGLRSDHAPLRVGQRLAIPPATVTARPRKRSVVAISALPVERALPPPRFAHPCCGPRNMILSLPDFVDLAPLFGWPVEGPVTSTFGRRRMGWHRGIDIKADRGNAIFAAAAGLVVASDMEPRYGRVVKIEHDGNFVTVYAHNEENLVEPGTRVAAGDPIATIGRSGRATAHHLHFEIRHDGAVYNPLYLLPLPPRIGQVEETDEEEND